MTGREGTGTAAQDKHFYIDNAPPKEVTAVLRVLSLDDGFTPDRMASVLAHQYGFQMQSDHTYSPRRLADLGLAAQSRHGGKTLYRLTRRGVTLQTMLSLSDSFAKDVLHYLHYSSYAGRPRDRKYLWSYRRCCEHFWERGCVIPPKELAALIQEEMRSVFPELDFGARVGARFNSTAASCVTTWLTSLDPSPIAEAGRSLCPRDLDRYELAALALDDLYRARGYRYGDPVLLDDAVLHQAAGVFFLKPECCRDLLHLAARVSSAISMADTLAGPSVTLTRQFTVDDL